ncbi:hypothetical protein BDZ89DRAFT_1059614 [Hymenopellis radicata]|nr:hypothetical protein BDZ89DRAFT_1059614 [Hymenopellis radicata]
MSCAGEFRITKDGYMDSGLLRMNDADRNYRRSGIQCLGPVATMMENLGTSLSQISWSS